MALPMWDTLVAVRRVPNQRNPFADVDHVDECGAPVLAADARPIPCENGMDPSTPVAIYGVPGSGRTAGFLTIVDLRLALRDLERGHLRRIGVAAFEVITLKPSVGPGLTAEQARRRHLASIS